jgi:foldase protein PrsA
MHNKRLGLAVVAGLMFALVLSGCGRKNTFVTVNGDKITKDEFYRKLEQLQVGNPPQQAGLVLLQKLIDDKLILQIAKDQKVSPTEAQVKKRIEMMKKQGNLANLLEQRGITLDELKSELYPEQARFNILTKGITIPEAEIKKGYDQFKDTMFTQPERANIAVIVCKTEDKIRKAQQQIKDGTDFSTVAMNLSEDTNSRVAGGKLGVEFFRGMPQIPAKLADTAVSLRVNQVSDPFQLSLSPKAPPVWLMVKALNHKPKTTKTYEDVKDQIREAMMITKGSEKVNIAEMLDKKRGDAKLVIKSDRYKAFSESITKNSKSDKKK